MNLAPIEPPGVLSGRRVRTIYVSDLHLDGSAKREHRVYAWLRHTIDAHPELDLIVLCGDVVEGYFRRANTACRSLFRLAAHLLSWGQCQVLYIPGNHDDYIGEHMADSGGRFVVARGGVADLGGGVHCLHGHQWAKGIAAATYRLLDRTEWRGGRWLGRVSQRVAGRIHHDDTDAFREGARAYAEEHSASVVIHGHTHTPHIETHQDTVILDLGSWVSPKVPPTFGAHLETGEHVLSWVS